MAAPTPVSSLVHSSTLVAVGVYVCIRFYVLFIGLFRGIFFIGSFVFTMFMAGLLAFFDLDMKKVVAFSTLSQLGFIIYGLFFGEVIFVFYHMGTHALFKSTIFMIRGVLIFLKRGGGRIFVFMEEGGFLPF